ncbi:MAG: glycosyltransferase [Anaerolineaceae bacterium]|nr:glycosyltransferase [Anaerolineaceae bacterium]
MIQETQAQSKMDCSIIIPNLHSPIIDRTIQSILSQETDRSYEVIVVGMDKFGLVEKFPEVKFIKTPAPVGAAEARNIGIHEAISDTLIFIDADCIAMPGWIDTFFADFAEGWQVIGGGVKSPTDNFWLLVYNLSMFHEQLASQPREEHDYLPTLNLAMKREVVEKVGPLNEALMRGQDIEWTSRMTHAGIHILFEPAAVVEHHPPRFDFEALRRDNYRSGYYMIGVRYEHPEIFHMPALLKSSAVWRIFKPLIAAWTTLKIVARTKEVRRNAKIIPYVYRLKAAWCTGAADRLEGKTID